MCGIVAYLALQESSRLTQPVFESLNQLHNHRGPDSRRIHQEGPASLGACRLSIVDVKGGDQPISSSDGRYTIVFNGEIYNYRELRQTLVARGHHFKTNTDTEVVLQAYIEEGPAFLSRLNGMFAFCIWDKITQRLFVARDRMGVKPLYYAANGISAMFSSELTPICQSGLFDLGFNYEAISDYLDYWYVCEPKTIFKNIEQFPPAHYGFFEKGRLSKFCYWQMPRQERDDLSFEQASGQLEGLLEDAIRVRIPGEVPFGTFLSGGIDSGLITAMAARSYRQRLKAFAIGFKEESYSELPEAGRTARRNNAELLTTQIGRMTPELLETIIHAFDEPLGNASYVPAYLLAKLAAQHVKVVLTGDGGDELFGGYPTYQAPYFQNIYQRTPFWMVNAAGWGIRRLPVSHRRISMDYRLKQFMKGAALPYDRAHASWRQVTPLNLQKELFKADIAKGLASYNPFSVAQRYFDQAGDLGVANQLMYVDMNTYLLNDHLRKVDRMTMAHSLEARLPFMDYRIVELAMQLPAEYKVTMFKTKRILKHVARHYLPARVIGGKKKGLTAPIAGWIAGDLNGYVHEALKGGIVGEIFNPPVVERLLEEHDRKIKDNSRIIWSLLTLQVWAKKIKTGLPSSRYAYK
jgi:asparagine synthase (glutamine-hydrolysing)